MSRNANFNQRRANEVLSPPPRPISLVQASPEEQINHTQPSRRPRRRSAVEKVVSAYTTAHKELMQLHWKNQYKSSSSKEIVAKVVKLQGEVTLLLSQLEKEEVSPRRSRAQRRPPQAEVGGPQDINQAPLNPALPDLMPPPPRAAPPQFPLHQNQGQGRPPVRVPQHVPLPREAQYQHYQPMPNFRHRLPYPPPQDNYQQRHQVDGGVGGEGHNFPDGRHRQYYE